MGCCTLSILLLQQKKVLKNHLYILPFFQYQVQSIRMMQERFEEQFLPNLSNQAFIQLQRKIYELNGTNLQSKFLLKVIQCTSNSNFIINCIQTQTNPQTQIFKIKQATNILNAVKIYYERVLNQPKKDMAKDSQAQRKMTQLIENFKAEVNQKLNILCDFKVDYTSNAAALEEAIYSSTQYLRDLLSRATDIKQYEKRCLPQLGSKLKQEIIDILSIFLSNAHSDQIQQVASRVVSNQILNCQEFFYEIKNTLRGEAVVSRIVTVIQHFDSYITLKNYGVKDINLIKIEFASYFYDRFSSIIPCKILIEILEEFLKNPQYHFTNRPDLSDEQKKELVQQLWLKQKSLLRTLMKAYKYKQTLGFKINEDIQKILNFLILSCKYNLTDQIPSIKQNLLQFKLIQFLDETQFVKDAIKKIYQFITSNCKDYLKAYNQHKCTTILRIDGQMKLKARLSEIIQHVPYAKWKIIEEQIMKGNLNIIQRQIHNQETIFQLRNWINKHFTEYLKSIIKKQTLKEKAQLEVTQFLVKKGLKGLGFQQIVTIVKDLMENPHFEVIQASRILTDQHKRDLKNDFSKFQYLAQYRKFLKIDLQYYEIQARMKIEEQVYKIKPTIPYLAKEKLIEKYLKCPKDSTIYEQQDISSKWKMIFLQTVKKISQVAEYIQKFDTVRSILKRDAYLSKLKTIFKSQQFEAIKQYVCIFGEVPFNNDGKIAQNIKIESNNTFKALNQDICQQFKQAQSSNQFRQFLEELPTISIFLREQYEARFIANLKKLFSTNYTLDEETQLTELIKNVLKNGVSTIINDKQLQLPQNSDLKNALLQDIRYKRLLILEKNMKENKQLFSELRLRKKIREIYHNQALMNINPEQKMKIIEKVEKSFQFQVIRKYNKINDDQKDSLVRFIKESNNNNNHKPIIQVVWFQYRDTSNLDFYFTGQSKKPLKLEKVQKQQKELAYLSVGFIYSGASPL